MLKLEWALIQDCNTLFRTFQVGEYLFPILWVWWMQTKLFWTSKLQILKSFCVSWCWLPAREKPLDGINLSDHPQKTPLGAFLGFFKKRRISHLSRWEVARGTWRASQLLRFCYTSLTSKHRIHRIRFPWSPGTVQWISALLSHHVSKLLHLGWCQKSWEILKVHD